MAKNDFQKTDKKFIILGIEHKKAKFFVINQGSILEINEMRNSDITNTTRGSYPSGIAYPRVDKIARHVEEHLHRFLDDVSQKANDVSKKYPGYFFVLAGREEVFPKIKKQLPKNLINKISSEIKADLDMKNNEILLKVRHLIEDSKRIQGQFG